VSLYRNDGKVPTFEEWLNLYKENPDLGVVKESDEEEE